MATSKPNELQKKLGVKTPEEIVPYLNILTYGESGIGKTYLCSTAQDHPDTKPMLFLDVEGGVTTIRHRKDIDVVTVRSIKDMVDTYNDLYKDTTGYYKTVCIDGLTELQDLDMREIMKEMLNEHPERDPDIASPKEWGKSRIHLRKIIRAYRDLPMNTIFTALSLEIQDEDTNIKYIFPNLPGKLRGEIPGFVDVVGYYYSQESSEGLVRRLQFAKTKRVMAKDRTQRLGDFVDDPSVPLLWEKLNEGS